MSTATKHMKRSHRSERQHLACLHQMKQYAPVGTHLDYEDGHLTTMAPVLLKTLAGHVMSKHALGRKNNLVQRLNRKLARVRGQ